MEEPDELIPSGFDRGLDFNETKNKLIKFLDKLNKSWHHSKTKHEAITRGNKICYVMIAMIQLRNGSRISEACKAFNRFIDNKDSDSQLMIKISKSSGQKYNIKTKTKYIAKARYRKMIFPSWFDKDLFDEIANWKPIINLIQSKRLEKRVLDFLLLTFKWNTHSLRYACINYLLNEQNIPMPTVAKFVGHVNVQQLVTYTQNKRVDEVFELDI